MPSRPRPRLFALAAVTAVLAPLLVAGPAAAEDPAVPGEVTAGDTVVGELVRAFADPEHADAGPPHPGSADAGHSEDGLLSWIDVDGGDAVRVPTEDVAGIEAGATVEVTVGGQVRDTAAAEQGLAPASDVVDVEVLAPAEPAAATAPATNHVTVVMVQPGGTPRDGATLAQVVATVDGPVRQFWEEQSDGAITVSVAGRYDWMSTAATCRYPANLWVEVADRIGWTGGPGEHLMLYVPRNTPNCSYGLGTIGSGIGDGGLLYVQDPQTSVIAHELGHNFGLGHASALQCNASPETAPCRTVEYWDLYDVMGVSWGPVGSLNAPHSARLGLLPVSAVRRLSPHEPGATHLLSPVGSRDGVRALALDVDGATYWIEYRAAVGRDQWLSDPRVGALGVVPGVTVRRDGPGVPGDTSLLLDGTPVPQAEWHPDGATVLPPRSVWRFDGDVTVAVAGSSPSGAMVTVQTPVGRPEDPITRLHAALGGELGPLGAPLAGERCGLRDSGCLREYQSGSIYRSRLTRPIVVDGDIRARWGTLGWENGHLGYPVSEASCGRRGGGCLQQFQGGMIAWSPATGAQAVDGAIRTSWEALGAHAGRYGYPVAGARCGLRNGGCLQQFQGGWVYWSPVTGAAAIDGQIRDRWGQLGWENGYLGYPVGGARCGLRAGGCLQLFQGGSIYWTPATGARAVDGAIRDRWGSLGWEIGYFGYPVTDARCGLRGGGCLQLFQGGSIYWSPATGAQAVDGAIRDRWGQLGWENGYLGYPVAGAVRLPNGDATQRFQGGTLRWSAATGRVTAS